MTMCLVDTVSTALAPAPAIGSIPHTARYCLYDRGREMADVKRRCDTHPEVPSKLWVTQREENVVLCLSARNKGRQEEWPIERHSEGI